MKKINSFLLAGALTMSGMTFALAATNKMNAANASAIQRTKYLDNAILYNDALKDAEDNWGTTQTYDGLSIGIAMNYRKSQSSATQFIVGSGGSLEISLIRGNKYIPSADFNKIVKAKISFNITIQDYTKFRYVIHRNDYGEENNQKNRQNLAPGSFSDEYTFTNATDASTSKYMLKIDAYTFGFTLTNFKFELYSTVETYPVTITAGNGIESAFLSTDQNATSGSASGTEFEKGSTVYGFVKLKEGYNPNEYTWTHVADNVYRVGQKSNISAEQDFGLVNAPNAKTYNLTYDLAGGTLMASNPDTYNVTTNDFTLINPQKEGYEFVGWSGTGVTGTVKNLTIPTGSTGDRSYTANWTPAQYTINYLDGITGAFYTGDNSSSLPQKHTYASTTTLVDGVKAGYTFGGWFKDQDCSGEPVTTIGPTEYTNTFNLFAKWNIKEAVQNAINKINNLPAVNDVNYPGSKAAIDEAFLAYEAVDTDDRTAVSNYSDLVAVQAKYKELEDAANAASVDQLITAIGTVSYPTSKQAIISAKEAFEALNDDAKALVTNKNVLDAAEDQYATLRTTAIDNVKDLIDDIGTVEYTPACKAKIDAARNAYDGLAEEDKNTTEVTNYQTLVDAESQYAALRQVGVDNVEDLITSIGTVEYTDACKTKIDVARTAYDALTNEQKALVENYNALVEAEAMYKHVDDAVKAINNIGEVSLESGEAVKTANDAYDALTDSEKALIQDYKDVLTLKTNTYDKMEHDYKVEVTCAIVFGVLGGLILLLCGAWALMMFVFNKWIKVDDKAIRAFKLFGLKKNNEFIMWGFPFKFVTKAEDEIHKTKEEALK